MATSRVQARCHVYGLKHADFVDVDLALDTELAALVTAGLISSVTTASQTVVPTRLLSKGGVKFY